MSEILGTIRASALSDLFDCPLRFYYKHIRKIQRPSSTAAYLGTAIHAGAGAFDAARAAEQDDVTVDQAVGVAVDLITHPQEEVDWAGDDTRKTAESAAVLTAKYCQQIGAKRRYKAVEMPCQTLDVETAHGVLRLTGHIDRLDEDNLGEGISDLKSGRTAVKPDGTANPASHAPQLGVYTLLVEHELQRELTKPAEIIGIATSGAPRVGTVTIPDVKSRLLGTEDYPGMLDMAAQMHKTGLFAPNPKSILCSEKYCPAYSVCPYHN